MSRPNPASPWLRRAGLVLLLATVATGCSGALLESHVPAPETYRLGAVAGTAPASPAAASAPNLAITVARPRAPSAIDTDRIAVVPAASRFEYYGGVRWAEAAPQMLQQNLVAALDRSGRFAGVYAAPARVPAELLLDVELRHFEAVDGAAGSAPTVHVQLQASLVDSRRAARLTSFVAEAQVGATESRRAAIVAAFERANAQVMDEVVQRVAEAVAAVPAPGS